MRVPNEGLETEAIFATLQSYREGDLPWRQGRAFGFVFDAGLEAERIGKRAFMEFLSESGLDPTVFPSLLRLENEVVGMAAEHLRAPAGAAGNFTSGGTESILLAVKAARDHARERRGGMERLKMLAPVTAHAAFHKAAAYLDVELVLVPVDPGTLRADVDAMRRAIDARTFLLVGSAPSYAHGVVDPIREMGALALERDLWLHVDGCIGGFLLPWLRELGAEISEFDFQVPGVSSLSMDFHKYAFCPKGASVILYRDADLRRHQIYACASWTGYALVNNTVQSTKSGGPLAATWAVLHHLGRAGYLDLAEKVQQTSRALAEGIEAIDGLSLMARPEMGLMAFVARGASVFEIADRMRGRGWYIQPQLAIAGLDESIHLSINPGNHGFEARFLEDLELSTLEAKGIPRSELGAQVALGLGEMRASEISPEVLEQMLGMAGMSGVGVPAKMAEVNEVLNALSIELREAILKEFVNQLFEAAR